jgi:hypothetical protein
MGSIKKVEELSTVDCLAAEEGRHSSVKARRISPRQQEKQVIGGEKSLFHFLRKGVHSATGFVVYLGSILISAPSSSAVNT